LNRQSETVAELGNGKGLDSQPRVQELLTADDADNTDGQELAAKSQAEAHQNIL